MNENTIGTMTTRELALVALNKELTILNNENSAETVNFANLAKAQESTNKALTALNVAEKTEDFSRLLSNANPALAAIKLGAITLTTIKKPNDKEPNFRLDTKLDIIDLKELKTFGDDNLEKTVAVFASGRAMMYVECLNHLVLDYTVGGMKVKKFESKLDTFRTIEYANLLEVDTKKAKTIGGIQQALQTVADKITTGLVISTDDAVALLMNYSKWGKAINGVSMPIEANFRKMITRVLYKVANGKEYAGE